MNSLLRRFNGPLTSDLVLEPGKHGLGKVPARLLPNATTTTVCGFCSTGCGLTIHLRDSEAINLTPAKHYPVNLGMACPKGWEALAPLAANDRGTMPLLRNAAGRHDAIDWSTAMRVFCDRFKNIQRRHGNASVAWIGTGQATVEDLAFLGALGKFGMGMLHGDGNTRQCMATAVVAYKEAFGFDAPPYTYEDFEESDVIVLIGSNLCIAHPIMWQRVLRNRHNPEIIVIDPRRTETAVAATQHFAIKPKSDLTFLYALANLLIKRRWIDREYIEASTEDFDAFATHVSTFTPGQTAEQTGIAEQQLETLAATIHAGKRVSFWWTMGVNQSHEGVRVAQAIINLALMTGSIGRPGTGANSITGQCNAMGSRLFSNTTNLLGGHDFLNPEHRAKVADTLGIDVERIPTQNSWSYDQIIDGIRSDKIKGLWVVATNPAHSWIHQSDLHETLKRLDFLVVQDMYPTTETAVRADLFLPAAGWGEKDGTLINSERRFGLVKKVARAPGQALSDFNIFRLVADSWGCGAMFERWKSPEAVFQILKELSRAQPCDITGIADYEMIDRHGGIQWPCPEGETAPATHRRLFADGKFFRPNQRAKFCFETPRLASELADDEYPFALLTGRGSSAQWHTQSRTGKSAMLRQLSSEEVYVELNPDDAARLKIEPHSKVEVRSRRGAIVATAFVTRTVQPGQVFVPMHYPEVNRLTFPEFDRYSRQPSYKAGAVQIRAVNRRKG